MKTPSTRYGSPYANFAQEFRDFLKSKKYESPSHFYRDLRSMLGDYAPSQSAIWMAFYGQRPLPLETVLFMHSRFGWSFDWKTAYPVRDGQGSFKKHNQLYLPGMRELRVLREAKR